MRPFKFLRRLEWKCSLYWRKIISLLLLSLVVIIITAVETQSYFKTVSNVEITISLSAKDFKYVKNYEKYNSMGVTSKFIPSPIAAFFTSITSTSEMSGNVNAITRLHITFTAKGVHALQSPYAIAPTFFNLIFFILPAIYLRKGYNAFKRKKFFKFLAVVGKSKHVFFPAFLLQLRNLTLYLLFLFSLSLATALWVGLIFTLEMYLFYGQFFLLAWLLLLVFFSFGAFVALFSPKRLATTALIVFYMGSVFVAPSIIGTLGKFPEKAIPSNEEIEKRRRKVSNDFEKSVLNKLGPINEKNRHLYAIEAERFIKDLYPLSEAIEDRLRKKILSAMRFKQTVSMLYPTTFFMAACNEISSKGPNSYDDYYRHLQEIKREFIRFWTDRVYYFDKYHIVKFIPSNIDIFRAHGSLPPGFWWGLTLQILLCAGLIISCRFRFNRLLFARPDKNFDYEKVTLSLKIGETYKIHLNKEELPGHLFNLFSGNGGLLAHSVTFNGIAIPSLTPEKKSLVYLPGPEHFPPGLKVKDLIQLLSHALPITSDRFEPLREDVQEYLVNKLVLEIKQKNKKDEKNKKRKKPRPINREKLQRKALNRVFGSLPKRQQTMVLYQIVSMANARFFIFDDFLKSTGTDYEPDIKARAAKALKSKRSTILDITSANNPLVQEGRSYQFIRDEDGRYRKLKMSGSAKETEKK